MKNYLIKPIVGALIALGSVFAFPSEAKGLENVVEPVQVVQADSVIAKKETLKRNIKTNVKSGGMYNDATYGAYFNGSANVDDLRFGLSYDHIEISDAVMNKQTDKKKERRVLVGFAEYQAWKNFLVGLTYDSDGAIGLYSTLAKLGMNRKLFSDRLYVEGNMALKVGTIDRVREKEDVLGFAYRLNPVEFFERFGFESRGEWHLPRKYIQGNPFDGPWTGTFSSAVTYRVTDNTRIGFDFNVRRDYYTPDFGLTRKGVNFVVSVGGKEKK